MPLPWAPPADVYRTRTGWLIKMDLAGVPATNIELGVRGSRLIVSGSRRDESIREGWTLHQLEISYSRFERVIELPEPLEGTTCRTQYREGMLLIEIGKEDGDEEA
jgi:HSP20 family protein